MNRFFAVGVSYKTADIDLRGCFSLNDSQLHALFLDAKAAIEVAPLVASMLAKELGKDKLWQQQQIKEFNIIAKHYIL